MILRLITDPNDPLPKALAANEPIHTAMPVPEYVVTYGCGMGLIFRPDGSAIEYEDHQPGCEHGIVSSVWEVEDDE